MTLTDKIIAFEMGELDQAGILDLFAQLVKTGLAWQLQGYYSRIARDLIEYGHITPEGEVLA